MGTLLGRLLGSVSEHRVELVHLNARQAWDVHYKGQLLVGGARLPEVEACVYLHLMGKKGQLITTRQGQPQAIVQNLTTLAEKVILARHRTPAEVS